MEPIHLKKGENLGQFHPLLGRHQESYKVVEAEPLPIPPYNGCRSTTMPLVNVGDACCTQEQKEQLQSLVKDYADVFSTHSHDYGRTGLVEHRIDTGEAKPVKKRAYRTSPAKQAVIHAEIDKLLEQGVIEESHSPWTAPVVLIKKKDGTYRFCQSQLKILTRCLGLMTL